jgi:thiosulfate/3-mercaptopyruvate sulfurtransferase
MRVTAGYANPDILIETDELEAELGAEDLRIIDCNVHLTPKPEGGYEISSGLEDWRAAHIPQSCFLEFEDELSDDHPTLRFMLPSAEQFARVMSENGIGNGHRVVVYSRGANYWATRLFLMFREFGFDQVRVLNGAWDKWAAEQRPTTQAAPDWPAAVFTAIEPAGRIIGKDQVLAALDDPGTCIMNALSPAIHSGKIHNAPYGRPGHIKGSVNLYALELIDPETNRFADAQTLRAKFDEVSALEADHVITYCGGGISATTNAFALMLLGKTGIAVYDGSMMEWGKDESLPMETGPDGG